MTDTVNLSLAEATSLSLDILANTGLSKSQCDAVTDVIIRAQRDECHSHGLYRLLGCAHSINIGRVNKNAEPVVTDVAPSIVKVNADHGFSSLAYSRGIELALDKATVQGLSAMAINDCYHFSALWPEVEPLAERGFAAIALTPSHNWVAPAGGIRPVFGTNPFAFAWPRPKRQPFVFDFATSATARGEIELHRRHGKPIAPGLAIDLDGEPTTDPSEALKGAMLTFGGHKGSALSAMIELLAGPLIGDMLSIESKAHDNEAGAAPLHGELIIIFDPASFLGKALEQNMNRAELLFEAITGQNARLPSQRRYEARQKTEAEGLDIPRALYDDLIKFLPPPQYEQRTEKLSQR
ncbi:Ldh family oxidoreductase [Rhizobium multihospitium]|uniref:Malate/lactate/ureidoglycolate dehydrogenase, LDH2 family n=1 Tax=Rhizobium multihospitium TaxID=410764 RepID=A0A1C3VX21_9HYPH|nr:Ldh family oxidoreductase [Rhizobium multihospitium]SCB32226.1 Malate/lactate/ureidoglycolate dehydrogenase, LDH2 family [Rhizobium multihospitium]